ncbi:unnamed protein product [Echinostoma caproni]|uniref:Uncharacterized protein n=1 Tax=Echinostoma caproni TaxID=27848 RepID=A0A183A4G2_9TREM|nr:unnamed protein product [Echinostoma caproni]
MGSGLPVVLCVDQLQANESACHLDSDRRHSRVVHSSSGLRDRSSRADFVVGKRGLLSDRCVESLESNQIKSGSARSSTTSLASSWVKQTSCPGDEITGFSLCDMGSNSGESNPDSVTTSPVCPGVMSVLNPSVDSGLGLNSDSTEFFDEHSELDGPCITAQSLPRDNIAREKSVSASPLQEKPLLPNLWEDSVLSLIVTSTAAKDHNRGRVYLTSIAEEMQIPVTNQIQVALDWCRTRLDSCPASPNAS